MFLHTHIVSSCIWTPGHRRLEKEELKKQLEEAAAQARLHVEQTSLRFDRSVYVVATSHHVLSNTTLVFHCLTVGLYEVNAFQREKEDLRKQLQESAAMQA